MQARANTRERFPSVAKFGIVVIAVGIVFDAVVHAGLIGDGGLVIAGFSLPEHAAHLIGLVGMVITLAGVVMYGARTSRRHEPPKGGSADAVR